MIESPLLDAFDLRTNVPTEAEFRHLCVQRGISFQREARALIDVFRRTGVFGLRMTPSQRRLLAVLTRTAGLKPVLAVDNTAS